MVPTEKEEEELVTEPSGWWRAMIMLVFNTEILFIMMRPQTPGSNE